MQGPQGRLATWQYHLLRLLAAVAVCRSWWQVPRLYAASRRQEMSKLSCALAVRSSYVTFIKVLLSDRLHGPHGRLRAVYMARLAADSQADANAANRRRHHRPPIGRESACPMLDHDRPGKPQKEGCACEKHVGSALQHITFHEYSRRRRTSDGGSTHPRGSRSLVGQNARSLPLHLAKLPRPGRLVHESRRRHVCFSFTRFLFSTSPQNWDRI